MDTSNDRHDLVLNEHSLYDYLNFIIITSLRNGAISFEIPSCHSNKTTKHLNDQLWSSLFLFAERKQKQPSLTVNSHGLHRLSSLIGQFWFIISCCLFHSCQYKKTIKKSVDCLLMQNHLVLSCISSWSDIISNYKIFYFEIIF